MCGAILEYMCANVVDYTIMIAGCYVESAVYAHGRFHDNCVE